jgi:hypothetical protein
VIENNYGTEGVYGVVNMAILPLRTIFAALVVAFLATASSAQTPSSGSGLSIGPGLTLSNGQRGH